MLPCCLLRYLTIARCWWDPTIPGWFFPFALPVVIYVVDDGRWTLIVCYVWLIGDLRCWTFSDDDDDLIVIIRCCYCYLVVVDDDDGDDYLYDCCWYARCYYYCWCCYWCITLFIWCWLCPLFIILLLVVFLFDLVHWPGGGGGVFTPLLFIVVDCPVDVVVEPHSNLVWRWILPFEFHSRRFICAVISRMIYVGYYLGGYSPVRLLRSGPCIYFICCCCCTFVWFLLVVVTTFLDVYCQITPLIYSSPLLRWLFFPTPRWTLAARFILPRLRSVCTRLVGYLFPGWFPVVDLVTLPDLPDGSVVNALTLFYLCWLVVIPTTRFQFSWFVGLLLVTFAITVPTHTPVVRCCCVVVVPVALILPLLPLCVLVGCYIPGPLFPHYLTLPDLLPYYPLVVCWLLRLVDLLLLVVYCLFPFVPLLFPGSSFDLLFALLQFQFQTFLRLLLIDWCVCSLPSIAV